MHRRQVLALLSVPVTGFAAGCGGQGTTETETPTATTTETPTDTETPTATATETPTATETATPGGPEREGNAAIAEVEKTLNNVVAVYGGPDSDSLLGTDASSAEFESGRIQGSLSEAEEELDVARERVVTRQQERTVDRLAVTIRFLDLATQIQIALNNAFFALDRARAALSEEEGSDARERLQRMENERRLAVPLLEQLRSETDAASVSVIDRIDTTAYEAKVAQFSAEISTMRRLRSPAETLSRGVDRLQTARQQDANNSDSAAGTASQAAEQLQSAETGLRNVLEGIGDDAASLQPITTQLVEMAATKTRDAREIAGETTATPTS
ncbi:coiled-coil domain-containing protein [Salinigranum halophilum]|uniref:hypothetical protein n=1 Tax=Salinigranum halophilum TaxID=2565931 RepID=UPI00191C162B|nr:hypothetical protein [Salinigranum halophilum]